MMSLFSIKCLACWISLLHCGYAFVVAPHPTNAFVASSLSSLSPKSASKMIPRNKSIQLDMVFGNKKTKGQKELEEVDSKYWQGEWVCKDCGYIYNRVSLPSSNQKLHFFVPQSVPAHLKFNTLLSCLLFR